MKINIGTSDKPKIVCNVCNGTIRLERHRIVPGLKYGGTYSDDNVIILCKRCHTIVHKFIKQAKKNHNLEGFTFSDFIIAAKNLLEGNFE